MGPIWKDISIQAFLRRAGGICSLPGATQLENQKWDSEVDAEADAKPIPEAKKTLLVEVTKICASLANEIDPIRKNYWEYFGRSLISRFGEEAKKPRDRGDWVREPNWQISITYVISQLTLQFFFWISSTTRFIEGLRYGIYG